MHNDVYAIYESYVVKENMTPMNANHTETKIGNIPDGAKAPWSLGSSVPSIAEETLVHKKIKSDINRIIEHMNRGDYGKAAVYCKSIHTALQAAEDGKTAKKKK